MSEAALEDDETTTGFENHGGVISLLGKAQAVEKDIREIVREVHDFLDLKDGQWDAKAEKAFAGRPRYTLDKCNDLVDDIAGAMEQSDFNIQVVPAGGEATKELAKTYDGLIRNIQNISNAGMVFNSASRFVVRAGMDGWRVNQRWGENNTFDQDLYVDPIIDFVDRVWWDPSATLQTRADAEYCFVLTAMVKSKYEKQWPDGKGVSISTDDQTTRNNNDKPEVIIIGELLYKVKVQKRIVEMSNGAVYIDDEKYKKVKKELAKSGVTEKRSRKRDMNEVKTRIFDGSDWLTEIQDTVFELIPIVPMYANWSVRRKVPSYWGIVTKKMDAQRIYNYTQSRMVEEGALAPLAKILVTMAQIGANSKGWEKLNTSDDPYLVWEVDEDNPNPPFSLGGAQINPGLELASQSMLQNLQSSAGIDQLPGQPLGLQSGLAVELKQNKGDTRNWKYTESKQTAICHTGLILILAIPRVYDAKRQVRLLNEDESFEMVTINDTMIDEETKKPVELIDLSKGVYDVTCNVTKSFKNRQSETLNSLIELAAVDPDVIKLGRDVLYNSLNAPGVNLIAERVRIEMVKTGQIPETQLTDEEKEIIANLPPPPPDPVAEALAAEAENAADETQIDAINAATKESEAATKDKLANAKIEKESMETAMKQITTMAEVLNKQADTWEKMSGALELISGPGGLEAFIQQAAIIRDSQAEQA